MFGFVFSPFLIVFLRQVPLGLSPTRHLPLGVQVVAAAGMDHVSIAVALALDKVFGGWKPPVDMHSPDVDLFRLRAAQGAGNGNGSGSSSGAGGASAQQAGNEPAAQAMGAVVSLANGGGEPGHNPFLGSYDDEEEDASEESHDQGRAPRSRASRSASRGRDRAD